VESSFSAMLCGESVMDMVCVVDVWGGGKGEAVVVGVVFVAASGSLGGA
jgi:hypothetical protein